MCWSTRRSNPPTRICKSIKTPIIIIALFEIWLPCRFVRDLDLIRNRHNDVVQTMAQGVIEMKENEGGHVDAPTESSIQYFLDRLYMSRISIRMLINQHSNQLYNYIYLFIIINLNFLPYSPALRLQPAFAGPAHRLPGSRLRFVGRGARCVRECPLSL